MNKKLIKHIAKLSCFHLTENELELYTNDLINICEIIDTIKNVNITGVEPMVSPINRDFKFRQDIPENQDNRLSFNKFAHRIIDDYFIVPQVIN